ncbi:hypothetical protein BDZ97DRAFT_865155 [Flammula alnicola]|nr:hypothetical protein BDZ97DRAFT_865155 [Flammula alnicola]
MSPSPQQSINYAYIPLPVMTRTDAPPQPVPPRSQGSQPIPSRTPTGGSIETQNSNNTTYPVGVPIQKMDIEYELPKVVLSVRDGWQWTCQSGAVVSGLLAAVAAQLLVFFKAPSSYSHASQTEIDIIVAFCYAGLFLNIGATISSFVLIDELGELGFQASRRADSLKQIGEISVTQENLLLKFGASRSWKSKLYHWLFIFYSGILALTTSVLVYACTQEAVATRVVMTFIVSATLGPTTYFIFRPLFNLPPVLGRRKDATDPKDLESKGN